MEKISAIALREFLCLAHLAKYNSENGRLAEPFELDGLSYHDTVFGDASFLAQEIIYLHGEPLWG